MQIMKARVNGFQSFSDSGDIFFGNGINLIVGPNNVGKSAFLRSLQAALPDDRHRTPAEWRDEALASPMVSLTLEVSGQEIRNIIPESGNIIIPVPTNDLTSPIDFVNSLLDSPPFAVNVQRTPTSSFSSSYPSHGKFFWSGQNRQAAARVFTANGKITIESQMNGEDTFPSILENLYRRKLFYFSAERFSIGQTATMHAERLDQNASNLAAVLSTMLGNRGDTFRKLVDHVRELFPNVGNLSTRVLPDNPTLTEIRVWPTAAQDNVRLSFPLMQSGTGVAQTISLLSAVMTVESAIIVIDEINSFLHPSAVKSLLRILQTEYSNHQYIISTHAPEVIGFSNPVTIHLVKRSGYESSISALDPSEVGTFREVASHLGVSMSDVFAADRVIWVEGETEETLFPYIYRMTVSSVPSGTVFTAVAATGDFGTKRRDKAIVYEAYSRLSEAVATMPVKVIFGFDTETLSESEKADMQRDSRGRLRFLPRRHLECYLLHPEALSARIRIRCPDVDVSSAIVGEKVLQIATKNPIALKNLTPDLANEEWLSKVNAAKLLAELFVVISDARIEYDKVRDGIEIVKWVLANDPDFLAPLAAYVRELVEAVQAD